MKRSHTALALLILVALAAPALGQTPPSANLAGPGFRELDADRDGRVSMAEVMSYALKKSRLTQPFRVDDVDRDRDGTLTREELLDAGVRGLERYGTINARDLDANGDGYVSREELDEFFRKHHNRELERADKDGDGSLSPSEFALFRF
jgi:Ca2+-binding EF-hand superfamily protein